MEIDFLTDHKPWSYWDVYALPIPIRKWFIKKIVEKTKKDDINNPQPLTSAQKQKAIAQSQAVSNSPNKVVDNPFGVIKR